MTEMPLGNFFRKKKEQQSKRTELNPPKADAGCAVSAAAPQHSFQAETEALLTLLLEDGSDTPPPAAETPSTPQ